MGDPQVSPEAVLEIRRNMRALKMLVSRLRKGGRPKASVKSWRDLKILKVYVYKQKVPKDGHGSVVIIDRERGFADAQFLNRFQQKWPKSSLTEALAHLKNAKVTAKPVWPSIILDDHGI